MVLQDLRRAGAFVGGKIVQNNHCTWFQHGCKLGFHIGFKGWTIHRPLDHPRRDQCIPGQSGNEGLSAPFSKGCSAKEPFAHRCPSAQAGKVGFHGGFVNKYKPVRLLTHARLSAGDPFAPCLTQPGPVTFLRDQPFFYMKTRRAPERGGLTRDGLSPRNRLSELQPAPEG